MEFLYPALVSFLLTVILTPPTIYLARRYHLVDDPKIRPHPAHFHKRIIPRAGGIPIFAGVLISVLLFIPIDQHIVGILIGGIILLITGLLDDFWTNFSPYPRLFLQLAAAISVVSFGVGITFITNPLGGILRLDYPLLFQFTSADLFAIAWIVWMMNMVNWSKGIDGQMPGMVTVAAIILGTLSLTFYSQGDIKQLEYAKLAFIVAGVSFGFLIFNWYPAKILPGFSASNILGFLIAVLAILSGAKLASALLVLLVPSADFFYTFFRRLLQRRSPVLADRGHLYHKLFDLGFTPHQIALFYILGSAILGAVSLSLQSKGKLFAAILVSIIILGGIIWINFFGDSSKRSDPDNG